MTWKRQSSSTQNDWSNSTWGSEAWRRNRDAESALQTEMEVSFRNFAIPNWFIHLATSAQTNFSSTNHRIAVIFNMQMSLFSSVCKVKVLSQIKVKLQEYAFHTDVEFFKCFTRARSPICFIISPEKNKKLTSAFSWKHTTSQAWIRQNTQKGYFLRYFLKISPDFKDILLTRGLWLAWHIPGRPFHWTIWNNIWEKNIVSEKCRVYLRKVIAENWESYQCPGKKHYWNKMTKRKTSLGEKSLEM